MIKFSEIEEKILEFWETEKIFKKTLKKDCPKGPFTFYEGPPTANGKPGIHHVLARAFKDLIPRYKTMQGYLVERKAGWDTHGLPVELQVEKTLEISGKGEIEKYGIEEFNRQCRQSVWQYQADWEKLTSRIGFWLDMDHPYVTYHKNYVESLWWIFKEVADQGLLYQGYKVVPHCPRCGTALSSHEVAQGYKSVTEPSVYIKFKVTQDKGLIKSGDYILSWTTTPWTLPGNVALAVGENFGYVRVKHNNDYYVLAKDRLEVLEGDYSIEAQLIGSDLLGLEYEPLFLGAIPEETENYHNGFKIYAAGFVTTDDGTGIVHTAVMYGEDDYLLGSEIGLPKYHTVDESGYFNETVKKWAGKFVKDDEVTKEIIKDLDSRGLLLRQADYTHDYPFCWRCDTPLLYYAKDSWFFKMSELRGRLMEENQKINWVPEHLKEGRFGEWLSQVKDWAISRERYWGTPLPIWRCEKCQEIKVIGSYDQLREQSLERLTKFVVMRHGQAENNLAKTFSRAEDKWPLTDLGRQQTAEQVKRLKDQKIDLIIASPVLRTRQTAEIAAKELGLEVIYDQALAEYDFGQWLEISKEERLNRPDYQDYRSKTLEEKFDYRLGKNGETAREIMDRAEKFLLKTNKEYFGKNILLITHAGIAAAVNRVLNQANLEDYVNFEGVGYAAVVNEYLTEDGKSFDPHRPYIDRHKLKCQCGGQMTRVPEVADCWFDSGSMPFAQHHYPFENQEKVDAQDYYPADFISEAIDQTRGWFYTLLAVGTLLGKGTPYQNVICLGHINDAKGQKMSKSKGNIVDPWEVMNQWGADALRFHLYTMNQPGETKNFDIKNVESVVKKNFNLLFNVLSFYQTYAEDRPASTDLPQVKHVLDEWILARLNQTAEKITTYLNQYNLFSAARLITDFIDDLSTWYLRRSRDRFKSQDEKDKAQAIETLGYVLLTLSKLMAPFTPFIAEELYRRLKGPLQSVHLETWPETQTVNDQVLREMAKARKVVELALAQRDETGFKVRQPLSKLTVMGEKLAGDLSEIIKDEVNVKEVEFVKAEELSVGLDIVLTEELKLEGLLRELVRSINQLRKEAGLTINDSVVIGYQTDSEMVKKVVSDFKAEILSGTISAEIKPEKITENLIAKDLDLNGEKLWLALKK
ncbi:MAG: isoleucine--tRNA ligase [Candidatus Komeilibacteria bacterium CG10_big_fil_rev_8_21_14_0_10_41_13]|uniref:Isoleucine--tRNA ligase n=1 Tax=Candidatus Komeilibacteria bacterium CG10_big_fil_rev_8_21_14_0_10_41_13 TaxID=1974476 RepID=A0A2M6WD80_9BACT|nr:MAG: isoleucine--tRNA ligase [Candidatus Komeilibacteria bacterium CG10_big_fil_rev_8_21_14_0_10_41_13]